MDTLTIAAASFAAGVAVRHFWSWIRPRLLGEVHIVVSGGQSGLKKLFDELKHKL